MINLSRRFPDVWIFIPFLCLDFRQLRPSLPFLAIPHQDPSSTPWMSPSNRSCSAMLKIDDVILMGIGYGGKVATTVTNPEPVQSPAPTSAVSDLSSQLHRTSISSNTSPSPKTPSRSPAPPPYGLAQADVLYNYNSNDEGDLNLVQGQRITILEYGKNSTSDFLLLYFATNFECALLCIVCGSRILQWSLRFMFSFPISLDFPPFMFPGSLSS
jgi:hypothetical protein